MLQRGLLDLLPARAAAEAAGPPALRSSRAGGPVTATLDIHMNTLVSTSRVLLAFAFGGIAAAQTPSQQGICPPSIEDHAQPANCIRASTTPVSGMLLPLGPELFVDLLGYVGIGTMSPQARLHVVGSAQIDEDLEVFGSTSIPAVILSAHSFLTGTVETRRANNTRVVRVSDTFQDIGAISTHRLDDSTAVLLSNGSSTGNGFLATYGPSASLITMNSTITGNGSFTVKAGTGNQLFRATSATFPGGASGHTRVNGISSINADIASQAQDSEAGFVGTFDKDDQPLTRLTSPSGNTAAGALEILNAGLSIAGINGGTGDVFGASKSFIQPHPFDAERQIHYVALEGPEHGVYFRGSTRLVDGVARIEVPESFRLVARLEGITVQITPTGPSRGLYVESKGLDEIVVRENEGGRGVCAFDYHVNAVRSAFGAHEPIEVNRNFRPQPGRVYLEGDLPGNYRQLLIQNGVLTASGEVDALTAQRLGWRDEGPDWVDTRASTAGQRPTAQDAPDEPAQPVQ